MTEPSPEVVATADISPVSPRPHYNTSPLALPSIQDQAEQLDVNSIDQLTSRGHTSNMAAEPSPAEPALAEMVDPTIAGTAPDGDEDQSLDESIADDDSFDAYGEDANGEAQNNAPGADNDDYARIFDSPAQGEVEEAEQDVSKAGESMNSSSASDTLPHQASVAPITGDISSSSLSHGDGALANPAPANPADTASLPQPASAPLPDATLDSAPSQPIHAQAEASSPEDVEAKPNDSEPKNEDAEMEDDATAVDIQKLVDDITAASAAASSTQPPAEAPSSLQDQDPQSSPMSVNQTLLPPRPALTQEPSNPAAIPSDNLQPGPNVPPFSPTGAPVQATGPISQPSPYPLAAAPGTASAAQSLPPPPASGYNAAPPFASYPNNAQPYPGAAGAPPSATPSFDNSYNVQQAYDAFLADERRYMSEAKWERFPEGSRIFIGNLSQERVSKKDVFDLFHKYGRLAQISLKSAYGFVQYHNVTDAQGAMENLQGAEIRGRKIHLEYSRVQKKKDRDNSPDRKGGRDRNRGTDRYDGRDQGRRSRDDYRPGRSPSPRREDRRGRDETYGRNANARTYESYDHGRGRSRSPERFGRPGPDASYRRRSPSPYGRPRQDTERLDIPRRYGEEIPDVQLLLMQEVQRDFVDWVQRAFYDRGLKTNVMFLNPARAPREAVIQRQVLEGVHAVIELDVRAQSIGRIPLQVFDRSAGINNVRYDQYQDLEPTIAAELVVRTKSQAAPQQPPAYPPNPYGQPYAAAAPQGYPNHLPQRPPASGPPAQPDLASLVGQIDNNALQQILASLQPGQPPMHAPAMPPSAHPQAMANPAAVNANSQIDINALLGNLKNAAGTNGPPAQMPTGHEYAAAGYAQPPGGSMPPTGNGAMPGGADPSAQVATIMQQLARFRQ